MLPSVAVCCCLSLLWVAPACCCLLLFIAFLWVAAVCCRLLLFVDFLLVASWFLFPGSLSCCEILESFKPWLLLSVAVCCCLSLLWVAAVCCCLLSFAACCCLLLSAAVCRFPAFCFLIIVSWFPFLLHNSCFRIPVSRFLVLGSLLPVSYFLFPLSRFFFPVSFFLVPLSCFPIPDSWSFEGPTAAAVALQSDASLADACRVRYKELFSKCPPPPRSDPPLPSAPSDASRRLATRSDHYSLPVALNPKSDIFSLQVLF